MATSFLYYPIAKNELILQARGKVTLITGEASGIGAAKTKLFVRHGAKVTIDDIQDGLGNSLVKEIGTEHVMFAHCYVVIESDVQNVVDATIAKFGKLDIMFSNAGIVGKSICSIFEVDYDIIKNVFDVNVVGTFFCSKHAARVMIPAKTKGSIIFTASIATTVYGDSPHTNSASKNAVLGLTKNVGVELGKYRIRVNCVCPYVIDTPVVLNALGNMRDKQMTDELFVRGNLEGALLDEQDVENGVLYLTNDDSKYVSGLNLIIDGGFSTTNLALTEVRKKLFSSTSNKIV